MITHNDNTVKITYTVELWVFLICFIINLTNTINNMNYKQTKVININQGCYDCVFIFFADNMHKHNVYIKTLTFLRLLNNDLCSLTLNFFSIIETYLIASEMI